MGGKGGVDVLDRQTYQGGTRGRRLWWGSPDLELEGMRKDTRHKIYTGSGLQGDEPYVLFGDQVWRLALGVVCSDVWLGTRPSFIVQGVGS
jgi:hypothetical protein